ncbi:hypothetical protein Tco_0451882 [Tanacetum coccineum]
MHKLTSTPLQEFYLYYLGRVTLTWVLSTYLRSDSSVPDTELVVYLLQDKLTSQDKSLDLSAFKLSRLFFSLLSSGSSSCWRSYGAQSAAHLEGKSLSDYSLSDLGMLKNDIMKFGTLDVRLRGLEKRKERKECLQEVRNTKAKEKGEENLKFEFQIELATCWIRMNELCMSCHDVMESSLLILFEIEGEDVRKRGKYDRWNSLKVGSLCRLSNWRGGSDVGIA